MTNRSTLTIGLGMLLGVAAGLLGHAAAADAAAAKELAGHFAIASDVFLRLVKMIIAPLVFATLVSGLANMDGGRDIGRVGVRSIAWFVIASFASLALGLVLANLLQPGGGLHLSASGHAADTGLATGGLNVRDVVTHAFPTSLVDAMARNDVLQLVVFSLFFGLGLNALKDHAKVGALIESIDALVPVMLRVTGAVMTVAPLGVFGAIASAVTLRGLGVLATYGKLVGAFYAGLGVLWAVLIGAGALFLGRRVVALLKAVREPALIAFSTASSEAAFPRLAERLEAFGIPKKIVGFTLPLGYAFNLDGSMMYQSFVALFIAQAFGVELSLGEQLTMLLVLMVSSKGMASVPRGSVVVVAAVAPLFRLPMEGIVLVLAIDQLLDMGRTMTNVIGNSIATAVVARWETSAPAAGAAAQALPVATQAAR